MNLPRNSSTASRACRSVTTSEMTLGRLLYSNACRHAVFAPKHVASLASGDMQKHSNFSANCSSIQDDFLIYLVMSGSVTRSLAFQATLRQSAPTVSIHRIGTSPQPISSRPSIIPQNRPPPPTDTTIAPGLDGNEAFSSCTILEWPFLKDLNSFSFLWSPKPWKKLKVVQL